MDYESLKKMEYEKNNSFCFQPMKKKSNDKEQKID